MEMGEEKFKSYEPESSLSDVVSLTNQQLRDNVTDINRINEGEDNAVYFAKLKSGREVVVRVSPKERAYNNFGVEAWALEKCRQLGVPTPRVLAVDTSTKEFAEAYMITEKLPGKSGEKIELAGAQREDLIRQVGHYLYLIHTVKPKGFGKFKKEGDEYIGRYDSFRDYMRHELEFSWWVKNHLETGLVSQDELNKLKEYFGEHRDMFELKQSSLVHGDMSPSLKNANMEGDTITGIFDMEDVLAHDPVFDFAWFDFWDLKDGHFVDALGKGYDNKEIFDENFETKLRFYQLMIGYSLMSYYHGREKKDAIIEMRDKIEILKKKVGIG